MRSPIGYGGTAFVDSAQRRTAHIKRALFPIFLVAIISRLCVAADVRVTPGKYVNEGGLLTIHQKTDGTPTFELLRVSPWNGHTCGPMNGEIRNGIAKLPEMCTLTFESDGDDLTVSREGAECDNECGAAVSFDGLYVQLPTACDSPSLSRTEQHFKNAYNKKDYAKALHILQPTLVQCGDLLEKSDADSMRNDLAITQYHLRDFAGCRVVLEPLRVDAAKTDEQLKEEYTEFALEVRMPGIRVTRTNLKLCDGSGESSIPVGGGWFRSLLPQITSDTHVPVLLPSALPPGGRPLYASAQSDSKSWRIEIGMLPNCSANACSVGFLQGEQNAPPLDGQDKTVQLQRGITGYYRGRSCGGSCSPPMIEWKDRDVTYTIQYAIDDAQAENQLIGLANSALLAGPR
jgi:hypothetical protein